MRLGLFMMPLHPPMRSLSETLAEDTAKSIYADQLGFDEVWMGEHFSATTEPFPAPLMFLANLLPQTSPTLKFGTGVINLPNHHPAIVAGEVAQFDHMSNGRFLFGIGPGGLISDFELFHNLDLEIRTGKLLEAVDFIKKIWAGDPPYELEGEYWTATIKEHILPEFGVGTMAKPLQHPHPPMHMALSSPNSSTAKLAAEQGWNIVSANIAPVYSVESHWRIYKEACEAIGRPANGADWRITRNLFVASSDAEAEDRVFDDASASRYYFTYMHGVFTSVDYMILLKPDPDMPDEACTPEVLINENVIYGSPETMLDKLVALRDRVGPFETLLMTGVDWSGPNEEWERESMRLLAEQVRPKFEQHMLATAAE